MKLDQLVATKSPKPAANREECEWQFIDCLIEADDDAKYVRLYRDPGNRRSYLLAKKEDLSPEVYEWTSDELAAAGFRGEKMYRVAARFGTQVQVVTIRLAKLGETLAAKSFPGAKAGCRHVAVDCYPQACCKDEGDGNCWCSNCCIGKQGESES